MEIEDLEEALSNYPTGTVIRLKGDRRNGGLPQDFVYLGLDAKGLILKPYDEKRRNLESYSDLPRFDLSRGEKNLIDAPVMSLQAR